MIIRRYINAEVLLVTAAVTTLLTVILMSGRVIQFFENASSGKIALGLITAVLWHRLPGFLELILPLGLFVGLLLALGRLYLDNEMAVLAAAGVGPGDLLRWLAPSVALVTLLTAFLSGWWTPSGTAASDRLYAEQAARSTFDLIQPGRFQRLGERMLYADLSPDRTELRDVVIIETRPATAKREEHQVIVQAATGRRIDDPLLGPQAVELRDGQRWEGRPGDAAYRHLTFERYRLQVKTAAQAVPESGDAKARPTPDLLRRLDSEPTARAEWGWRWSLVVLVPVVTLLAIPLARVNPRQGRYLKLLPAIMLFFAYIVLIVAVKNGVEEGSLPVATFWAVHALFLLLGTYLLRHRAPRRVNAS